MMLYVHWLYFCCDSSNVISSQCLLQDQLAVCEKRAAEHQMFVTSLQELMSWLESCRQQLVSSDSTQDAADHWV